MIPTTENLASAKIFTVSVAVWDEASVSAQTWA